MRLFLRFWGSLRQIISSPKSANPLLPSKRSRFTISWPSIVWHDSWLSKRLRFTNIVSNYTMNVVLFANSTDVSLWRNGDTTSHYICGLFQSWLKKNYLVSDLLVIKSEYYNESNVWFHHKLGIVLLVQKSLQRHCFGSLLREEELGRESGLFIKDMSEATQ